MDRVIYRERFRPTDRRLGRHVHHDDRSRAYAFRAPRHVELHTVRHERYAPVFDQGDIGSCTGNAAIGCLATGAFFATVDAGDDPHVRMLDEAAALWCYSAATDLDPYPGQFPPDDTGSDGLSVAKVLTSVGAIAGYRHTFTLEDMLAALQEQPLITGTTWLDGMYEPDRNGVVHPTGQEVGGHEYVVDSFDSGTNLLGFTNSWGTSWGKAGRFFMGADEFGALLGRDGDVTVFVPATTPEPQPDVPADPDRVLADAVGPWARRDALCGRSARRAMRAWLTAKGL